MKLIDVHCHLESEEFQGNLDRIISEAHNAGIVKLITSSITRHQWDISREISRKYSQVEFTIGVHPWYVTEDDINICSWLEKYKNSGAIAIGEIGLDRKIREPDFDLQKTVFEEQMAFAVRYDFPVIIHCRGAFNELELSLKKTGLPSRGGLIHAFSGSPENAIKLMDMGLSFSMGGTLTYRNSRKRSDVLKKIFPHRFMLETDSPDIPPVNTDRPNVPANIILNLAAASEITGVSMNEVAERTSENAGKLFRLKI